MTDNDTPNDNESDESTTSNADSRESDFDASNPLRCAIAYCADASARLGDSGQARMTVDAARANLQKVLDEEFNDDDSNDSNDSSEQEGE